jgi:hypothetical protein
MDNFATARENAFVEISKRETVTIVDKDKLDRKFHHFAEVWEIKTIVSDPKNIGKEVTLHLCLHNNFPLSLPIVYLSKESYNSTKYIPHVDSNYQICTFDSEINRTDPENPYGIIDESLRRSKQIIEIGLRKENLKDFEEEFLSYWECKFDGEKKVNQEILSLIEKDPTNNEVRLLKLERKLGCYSHILYQESEENLRFLKFLEENQYKFKDRELFFAKNLQIANVPPFDLSNKTAIEKIKSLGEEIFKEFVYKLNKSPGGLYVLFLKTINGKNHYLGWVHSVPNLFQKGFRVGKITPYTALTTFQAATKVERVSPEEYTDERMNQRTAGMNNIEKYKIFIAGIGSIGSNLLHFLNSLSFPEFRLVDYETLTIENIGRHLLGINYVDIYKTIAAKDYLNHINPKQNILTKELSIIEVFETDQAFINDCDFLFIVTGKWNIESWVAKKIESSELIKPTFIVWVEPYLAGGHCIFIHPKDFKHDEFYHSAGDTVLFNWNVINDKEFKENKSILTLKEASCQTSFTPYSGANVVLFLSAVYPRIIRVIREKTEKSFCMSWIGDKNLLNELEIKLSDFGNSNNSFELIENGL